MYSIHQFNKLDGTQPNLNMLLHYFSLVWMHWLGVSTGWSGSGLCPTCNWPETRWLRVFGKKTHRRLQKPIGQVWFDLFDRRSDHLKPKKMLLKVPFGGNLYFSLDFHQIWEKNTKSSLDLGKKTPNHRQICAKPIRVSF